MPSASSNEANQFVTSPKASGACPKPRKRAATCAGVVASLAIPWTCTRNQEGIPHKELPEFLDFQLFGTTLLVVNKQPFCWTIHLGSEKRSPPYLGFRFLRQIIFEECAARCQAPTQSTPSRRKIFTFRRCAGNRANFLTAAVGPHQFQDECCFFGGWFSRNPFW